LSVRGGLHQTCWDEQFDIEIIPIPLADVERLRSNRFYGFCRFGFREGVVGIDDYVVKVSSAFALFISLLLVLGRVSCKFFLGSCPWWVGLIKLVETNNLILKKSRSDQRFFYPQATRKSCAI
jgi:hypothetical protein